MSDPQVMLGHLRVLLTPLAEIPGLLAFAVLDPVTATPLLSQQVDDTISETDALRSAIGLVEAYRAVDVASSTAVADSEVHDVVVTLSHHYQVVHRFPIGRSQDLLVVVLLDLLDTNLAMALRVLRRLPLPLPELMTSAQSGSGATPSTRGPV